MTSAEGLTAQRNRFGSFLSGLGRDALRVALSMLDLVEAATLECVHAGRQQEIENGGTHDPVGHTAMPRGAITALFRWCCGLGECRRGHKKHQPGGGDRSANERSETTHDGES